MRRGLVTLALSLTACPGEKPIVTDEPRQFVESENASFVGVYEQLNVKKGPGDPLYNGRAVIRNGDSVWLLETHDAGIRSDEEIATFEGKRVRVYAAVADEYCTAWGDGTEASIVSPCLRNISAIELE